MCCLVEGNASSEVVSKACEEEYELTKGVTIVVIRTIILEGYL